MPKNIPQSMPTGWGCGYTESGWMNAEAFFEYVTNVFFNWITKNNITLPVALFLDDHTSHISLALSEFCKANVLVPLVPNTTHIMQALDVAVFRPVSLSGEQ